MEENMLFLKESGLRQLKFSEENLWLLAFRNFYAMLEQEATNSSCQPGWDS